jgi:hypothetical protein
MKNKKDNTQQSEPFLSIPHSLLHINPDQKLSWLEKIIIAYRLSYGDRWFASNEHTANKFFTTKKTVCIAFKKARKLGILPEEQILVDDIINQSGSANFKESSYLQVTDSHLQVTSSHLQVTSSHLQVTAELPTGNQKTANLPMKTDDLLDQFTTSVLKDQFYNASYTKKTENDMSNFKLTSEEKQKETMDQFNSIFAKS